MVQLDHNLDQIARARVWEGAPAPAAAAAAGRLVRGVCVLCEATAGKRWRSAPSVADKREVMKKDFVWMRSTHHSPFDLSSAAIAASRSSFSASIFLSTASILLSMTSLMGATSPSTTTRTCSGATGW